ncbi:MAG TPA: hypothetical protein DET40_05830 [Lentisphaeria bacterium]|nr:MAG: hypothetical protein A2X45_04335 [Lentisphaerae bacterium GWF2_50_93]HCE43047.1 hypothetical protein [Lentisphaeria bacterium]
MKFKFEEIYDVIKAEIRSLPSGTRLPRVRDLMSEHEAAQITIQKVLDRLEEENLISRHTGRGIFKSDGKRGVKIPVQKKILLALPMHPSPFFDSFVNSFLNITREGSCTPAITRYNVFEPIDRWIPGNAKYDGIIIIPPGIQLKMEMLNEFSKLECPMVVVDRYFNGLDFDCVCTDNLAGGALAAEHFRKISCKKTAVLVAEPEVSTVMDRATSFSRQMRLYGFDEPIIINANTEIGEFSSKKAYEALTSYVKKNGVSFNGIFCVSDPCALGAMKALHDLKINIPQDVSVIGYDDMVFSEFFHPSLTTVRQDIEKIARMSIDIIDRKFNGGKEKTYQLLVSPELIVRESTLEVKDGKK